MKNLSMERVVNINEILKNAINTARRIDIVAFNAVLVAKRAGAGSLGFHVVANELRSFGGKIEEEMTILGVLIQKLVHHISNISKLNKNMLLFDQAFGVNDRTRMLLQERLAAKRALVEQAMTASDEDWGRLDREIRRALSLCKRGAMLSNNGRIEASYGKTMSVEMHHIATQIDEIMDRAVSDLKQLNNVLS